MAGSITNIDVGRAMNQCVFVQSEKGCGDRAKALGVDSIKLLPVPGGGPIVNRTVDFGKNVMIPAIKKKLGI